MRQILREITTSRRPLFVLLVCAYAVRPSSDGIPLVGILQAVGELGVGADWADGCGFWEGLFGRSSVGYAVAADGVVADGAERGCAG